MYGPPMRLYVYRLHGYHCANVVTGPTESASAVLIALDASSTASTRARERRLSARDDDALAAGPAASPKRWDHDRGPRYRLARPVTGDAAPAGAAIDAARILSGPRVGVRRRRSSRGGSGLPTSRQCRPTAVTPRAGEANSSSSTSSSNS